MKKHAIIPIFIPHKGCPNDCVFCNQKAITARTDNVSPEDVRNTIETYLPTLQGRNLETIEIAFFGGSFTGIPIEEQSAFLAIAKEYKDKGLIDKIHMSTRPDYIDREILDNLKFYGADIIELGVQSFDPDVLKASNRGHSIEDVHKACDLIKEYGFELGIQLMIGLPGDSMEKCIYSVKETIKIGPSVARLYPTIVLNDTKLLEMYQSGEYKPLSQDEALDITKEMYRLLDDAGITILRVGLKSTDLITEGGEICGNTYHPAFRQLVEGEIAKEKLEAQLIKLLESEAGGCNHEQASSKSFDCDADSMPGNSMEPSIIDANPGRHAGAHAPDESFTFLSSGVSFSNMIGNAKRNKLYFAEKYPDLKIRFKVDSNLEDGHYTVVKY